MTNNNKALREDINKRVVKLSDIRKYMIKNPHMPEVVSEIIENYVDKSLEQVNLLISVLAEMEKAEKQTNNEQE